MGLLVGASLVPVDCWWILERAQRRGRTASAVSFMGSMLGKKYSSLWIVFCKGKAVILVAAQHIAGCWEAWEKAMSCVGGRCVMGKL